MGVPSPGLTADVLARLTALERAQAGDRARIAALESAARQKARREPSARDRALLAAIIAKGAPLGEPFEVGELTDDAKLAQRWGLCLGRLANFGGVVDAFLVQWLGELHNRAQWLLRPVEETD
jgi:hypothetical protein